MTYISIKYLLYFFYFLYKKLTQCFNCKKYFYIKPSDDYRFYCMGNGKIIDEEREDQWV